jgi:hypothetical protein
LAQQAKTAFIVGIPDGDPAKQRSVLSTQTVELTTVFVKDRKQAVEVAKQLADQGCKFFELCSSFGHSGAAEIAEAVKGKAMVGAVRFDLSPVWGGKSADEVF